MSDASLGVTLTNTEVIIVAVVCSVIIVVLLIILAVVYCKWKRQKPEPPRNFENETNQGRPVGLNGLHNPGRSIQLIDMGDSQYDKARMADSVSHISNGGPPRYADVITDHRHIQLNTDSDSLNTINRVGYGEPIDLLKPALVYNKALYPEMHGEGQVLTSPIKDSLQLGHAGLQVHSESGYSTPDSGKPKKVLYEVVV